MLIAQCNGCRIMKTIYNFVCHWSPGQGLLMFCPVLLLFWVSEKWIRSSCLRNGRANNNTTWKCDGLLSIATLTRGTFNTIVFNDLWLGLAV